MEEIAERSTTVEDFKSELLGFLATCDMRNEAAEEARKQIRLLLQYDGGWIYTNCLRDKMPVRIIRLLHEFPTETLENMEMPMNLFIEIFQMFGRLKGNVVPLAPPFSRTVALISGSPLVSTTRPLLSLYQQGATVCFNSCCSEA